MLAASQVAYSKEEVQKILAIRCEEEDVEMAENALDLLTKCDTPAELGCWLWYIVYSLVLFAVRFSLVPLLVLLLACMAVA